MAPLPISKAYSLAQSALLWSTKSPNRATTTAQTAIIKGSEFDVGDMATRLLLFLLHILLFIRSLPTTVRRLSSQFLQFVKLESPNIWSAVREFPSKAFETLKPLAVAGWNIVSTAIQQHPAIASSIAGSIVLTACFGPGWILWLFKPIWLLLRVILKALLKVIGFEVTGVVHGELRFRGEM